MLREGRGARGKRLEETGKEIKLPFVHIFRFRDGKVERAQLLFDTALAAEALGTL